MADRAIPAQSEALGLMNSKLTGETFVYSMDELGIELGGGLHRVDSKH